MTPTVALDAVTLAGFVVFAYATHAGLIVHGQPWADGAMFFHFGHKLLTTGKIPFRDYVFQVGPLPIYVDALFQKVFGASYASSLWAALMLKSLLAFVVNLFAARWVGRAAGVLLGIFLLLDPTFSFQHHWSTPYALLFALLAIFAFTRAYDQPAKRARWLAASGAFVACIVTARQSGAAAAVGAVAVVTVTLTLRFPESLGRRGLLLFWGALVGTLGVFAVLLAAQGALAPTVQQLIVDAPAKKSVLNVETMLDMLSGGGLVERTPPFTPFLGFLFYNGAPLLLSVGALIALRRRSRQDAGGVVLALLPIAIALGRISSTWAIGALDDLPRVFGLCTLCLVLATPRAASRMLGIPAPIAAMILALPLALEAALEASYHGRGWVDFASMMAMALLVGLRSKRISAGTKTAGAAAFALVGVVNALWLFHRGFDPYAKDDMFEGTLADTRFRSPSAASRGVTTDETKVLVTGWLRKHVHAGDTCFVYGTSAMLYDLLECENPTRLDITISDFFSERDGEVAVADLRRTPPDWIIAAEIHWTNPDLATPFTGDESIYWGGPNGAAAKTLHLGVQALLGDYDVVGETSEALRSRPELLAQAEGHPEKPHRFRLYHRRQTLAHGR